MNVLSRLRDGLRRTKQQLAHRIDEIVRRADTAGHEPRPVDIETIEALEEILLSADVGVAATERIMQAVGRHAHGVVGLRDVVKTEIKAILATAPVATDAGHFPKVILLVGVNGTGKTTTAGKLAKLLKSSGFRPMVCAADTFRAAAVRQLDVWTERAGVDFMGAQFGADPAAVVFDAIASSRARGCDTLIVDTAGRLHTRVNLMSELDKIRRVTSRQVEGAPHEVLLVLDATVGQNGLVQAREFMESAGVNGIVLTKLDGTAKGGVVIGIGQDLKLPIRYVGVGEGVDDLVAFSADEYVDALFEDRW